jgi:hypothetical protein
VVSFYVVLFFNILIRKRKIKLEIDKEINTTMDYKGFYYWNYCGISFKGKLNLNGFHIKILYDPTKSLSYNEKFVDEWLIIKNPRGIKLFKEFVEINVRIKGLTIWDY